MAGVVALVDTLTKGARDAFPFIQSLAATSASANEILRQVSAAGMQVRRADGLKLISAFRNIASQANYIKAVRKDFLPNPARFAESVTRLLRNYSYSVRVEGTHPATGEKVQRWITVSTNDVLTKSQVEDEVYGIVEGDPTAYAIDISGIVVEHALRSPIASI